MQRLIPYPLTYPATKNYAIGFGTLEIITKSVLLATSFAVYILIRNNNQVMKKCKMTVHTIKPRTSEDTKKCCNFSKTINVIRCLIPIFLIFGSLLTNVVVLVASKYDKQNTICSSRFYWFENVNLVFEYLKRLHGFYLFFYVFAKKENYRLVLKLFSQNPTTTVVTEAGVTEIGMVEQINAKT